MSKIPDDAYIYPLNQPVLPKRHCYFIYFKEKSEIAIFSSNMEARDKIVTPMLIINVYNIYQINFSIPKKLYDLKLFLMKRTITFRFKSEERKNIIGNDLKKKIKQY